MKSIETFAATTLKVPFSRCEAAPNSAAQRAAAAAVSAVTTRISFSAAAVFPCRDDSARKMCSGFR
jgi:hypothetical protein